MQAIHMAVMALVVGIPTLWGEELMPQCIDTSCAATRHSTNPFSAVASPVAQQQFQPVVRPDAPEGEITQLLQFGAVVNHKRQLIADSPHSEGQPTIEQINKLPQPIVAISSVAPDSARCRPLQEEPRPCSEEFVQKVRKFFTCKSPDQLAFLNLPSGTHCGFGGTWPSRNCILLECFVIGAVILVRLALWLFAVSAAFCTTSSTRQRPPTLEHRLLEPPLLKDTESDIDAEPRVLHHRFVCAAVKSPNAIALIDSDEQISYGELQNAALRVVWLLVESRAVKPCSRTAVGICADGRGLFEGILGIVQTGNPYVPFIPQLPASQVDFIIQDADIKTVLVDSKTLASGGGWERRKESVLMNVADKLKARPTPWTVCENDLCYILYTSGSTGKPKGVLAAHRSYHSRLAWMWKTFPFEAGEVCIHKTVPIWVDHVQEIFGYLGGGVPVVIAPSSVQKDPMMLTSLCRNHGVSRIVLVPSLIRILVAMHGAALADELPKLRYWITSGEPLSTELLKSFLSVAPLGSKITNTYGSTEVAGDVTWVTFQEGSQLPLGALAPIGKPMPGVQIHILEPETLLPVEVGSPGELFVEGDFLAEGYINRPEEEATRFLKIPSLGLGRVFRTGDFGRLDSALSIEFLGRKDQQVKVHGQRVEVLHVEHVLQNTLRTQGASIRTSLSGTPTKSYAPQAVVMGVPSKTDAGSYHLHAFIEAGVATERWINVADVKLHMQQSLIPAHIPEFFWTEDVLPRLPNSKIDRTALMSLAEERSQCKGKGDGDMPMIQETDSFGQIRYIAGQYADSRRALGNMMTFALFKVVLGHFLEYWYAYGVVPRSSTWLQTLVAESLMTEDTGVLIFALATIHGMGGEERFRLSKTEPMMLALWAFMMFFLGPLFSYTTTFATGANLWKCYAFFTGSHAYVFTPCNGPRISYFLLWAAVSRLIIIVWHRLVGKLSARYPAIDALLIALVTIAVELINPGVPIYMSVYLASFYFGPRITQTMSSVGSLRPWACMIMGLAFYIGGCGCLVSNGILPPFDDRCRSHVEAVILSFPVILALLLFFMNLPRFIDFQMPGHILLVVYMTHYFFMNWVLHGVHFYGVRVLPSQPDLLWLACQTELMPLKVLFEICALVLPAVGFMLSVNIVVRMISASVNVALRAAA